LTTLMSHDFAVFAIRRRPMNRDFGALSDLLGSSEAFTRLTNREIAGSATPRRHMNHDIGVLWTAERRANPPTRRVEASRCFILRS